MPSYLTADQVADFHRDGVLCLPGFASRADCEALMARAAALVDAFEPARWPSVFTTAARTPSRDAYFLGSGADIRFFLEPEAIGSNGRLTCPKHEAINKIGHALHDRDPVFDRFSRDRRLAALVDDLGVAQPTLIQSMYLFKSPRIGGEVACHQDATFLATEPDTVIGLWFALEDATRENGCMWALPGAHRDGLRARFVRTGEATTQMRVLDPTPYPPFAEDGPYVPLEAAQGTLVVLHGLLPHLSGANRSPRSRHAYAVHVLDGSAPYAADNWLQRPAADPARGF